MEVTKNYSIKKLIQTIFILSLAVITVSCSQNDKNEMQVAILHTNDMHASIDNMDKLAAYKQQMDKQYDHVFLVSAGDIFSGNPVVDEYEQKGYPIIDLMNKAGYNLSAIGNHEFDYGQEVLAERMEEANFPFICANIKTEGTSLPQPDPYAVLEANGKKIFILSLIEIWNDGLPSTHPLKLKGLEFEHPEETTQKYMEMKKDYDAFIALTHLGHKSDIRLAEKFHGFDLIIGGHSHTLTEKAKKINNTWIVQAGDDINHVGKVILTFNKDSLTNIDTEVFNLGSYKKKDKKITSLIEKYNNNEALQEVIGIAEESIKGKEELGALFTDAQIETHNLDFAFQNNGGIRIPEIPKGEITVSTIYKLDPFGNELMEFEMKPSEMKSLLRYAYQKRKEPSLQVGGGSYTLYVNNDNELQKIVIKDENDNTLHPDSTYSVGLNSYISSSYTFEHADSGRSVYATTAKNLIEYIREKETIDYSGVKRIFVEEVQ